MHSSTAPLSGTPRCLCVLAAVSAAVFANSYRSGGEFLLLLKKRQSGELTLNWYVLGPVNEQLHSTNDPWLLWVREQVEKQNSRDSK